MPNTVALLAEGVGRNLLTVIPGLPFCVALLAEGVGRNCRLYWVVRLTRDCRPPRGGRG